MASPYSPPGTDRAEGVREHYRAEGAGAERERIIALLQAKCECTEWMCAGAWSPQGQTQFCRWHHLIHEIKGEQK